MLEKKDGVTSEEPVEEVVDEPTDDGATDDSPVDDKDNKESKATKFFDPKKVPAELQPTYKAMQDSFTKKMQSASLGMRKAQAFDELVGNPEFQAWVAAKNDPNNSRNKRSKNDDDDDDDDDGGKKGKGSPDIEAMIERAVARSLAPVVQGEHRKNAQSEWKGLIQNFPQAENYKDEIGEILRELPGIGYERAFKMVAFDDAIDIGSDTAFKQVGNKKRANTGKPSDLNIGDKIPPRPKTIPEAFKLAVKMAKDKERG